MKSSGNNLHFKRPHDIEIFKEFNFRKLAKNSSYHYSIKPLKLIKL